MNGDKCPLCGGEVVYRGMFDVACIGADSCANLDPTTKRTREIYAKHAAAIRESLQHGQYFF